MSKPYEILKVSPTIYNVEYNKGQCVFTVQSNVYWHVSSDSSWCTAIASEIGDGSFAVNYEQNDGEERKALITVKGLQLEITLKLIQYSRN